jgi:ABC-type sugar transport system substrate-binding protein
MLQKGLGKQTQIAIVTRQRLQPNSGGGEAGLHEMLVSHPHLECLVAETGLMALGASQERDRQGSHVLIAMIGSGTEEEKQAIEAGKITEGVMLDPKSVGERSVTAAFHYAVNGTLSQPTAAKLTELQARG